MSDVRLEGIGACVFDAYGTLFDVAAAAGHCQAELGDKWQPLADIWRQKQLQYTWLRSLMGDYVDFWQITQDGLDFAMASLGIDDAELRGRLLDLYMKLDCYPEVPEVLGRLKAAGMKTAGMKTAVLSNGSPAMLAAAVEGSNLTDLLDAVISVDDLRIYKPTPAVYAQVGQRLGVDGAGVAFQSSNAWDAHGAAAYGFQVVWVNRFGQAAERLPGTPRAEVDSLRPLPEIVGLG